MDMKLEVVVLPVSDVDRAKDFYDGSGWRLDADFASGDDFRVVQLTPPGLGVLGHLRHRHHLGRAGLGRRACTSSSTTSRPRGRS